MPTLDLTLCLGIHRGAADMAHAVGAVSFEREFRAARDHQYPRKVIDDAPVIGHKRGFGLRSRLVEPALGHVRITNCQIGVFAAYVSARDHTPIDRALVAQVLFSWVAADAVYGVGEVKQVLQRACKGYVLGVKSDHFFGL